MRWAILALALSAATVAGAYGIATFTGRVEYLDSRRLMCEYITSEGMVFTVIISGGFCPNSISI